MNKTLPKDLFEAEDRLQNSIQQFLLKETDTRLSFFLKFEGLRLLPIVHRFSSFLISMGHDVIILFADAGGSALAKNNYKELSSNIYTFKEYLQKEQLNNQRKIVLAVGPRPYDYEQYEQVCNTHSGKVIMLNGLLEDPIVGIGTVARKRRAEFIRNWSEVFFLEPLSNGAIIKEYPFDWNLFAKSQTGYRYIKSFTQRPTIDEISESLINEL